MRFLVDAQLPRRLAARLVEAGHDAVHTLDLPEGNRTTDEAIIDIAAHEQRIVVTKDSDFVHSFHLRGQPEKLLLIATGNISNAGLNELVSQNLPAIITAFESNSLVELTRTVLIIHG